MYSVQSFKIDRPWIELICGSFLSLFLCAVRFVLLYSKYYIYEAIERRSVEKVVDVLVVM